MVDYKKKLFGVQVLECISCKNFGICLTMSVKSRLMKTLNLAACTEPSTNSKKPSNIRKAKNQEKIIGVMCQVSDVRQLIISNTRLNKPQGQFSE